jgi:hypothetical protein
MRRRKRTAVSGIDGLKREVFYSLLEIVGRVFVHVGYSEDARIGRRGFLPEEKEDGLVLVFNNSMKFSWDETGLDATLVFGAVPEKCHIPLKDIKAIYSPELGAQFLVGPGAVEPGKNALEKGARKARARAKARGGDKLIKVDFRKVR